ncbi:MAG: indolepyruvate oxidoreductase subunit beta [Candidatus Cloacimonetes bacterium]|nr:indolepyruvate oxidoreductase subunit beta [Candidatus Cloacimonadota bacterium]
MRKDIILAGVGGQGILSIATIIGYAAIDSNMNLKQAEVHGMSQRGGDVQSHLRISDKEIYSDLIGTGQADMIISVEPLEALRYTPYLSKNGWMISNIKPVENISNYPDIEGIKAKLSEFNNKVILDADNMAKEIGAARSMNMVVLGAASPYLDLPLKKLEEAIEAIFGRKGEKVVEENLKALHMGREFAENNK